MLCRFRAAWPCAPLALGLLLAGASPAASQVDTLSARIQGVLLDEQTRGPVAVGLIRLLNAAGETVASVESDAEGRFSISTPGPAEYHLRVERVGYQVKESGSFTLPPGYVLSIQIHLSPAPLPLDSVWVSARRRPLKPTEQLILGRLLDYESGEPIAQGTITLLKAYGRGADDVDTVEETLSDDDGTFTLFSPLPGEYRLRGERIGYRTSESANLNLMPGDSIALDLYMSMEAIILDPITVRASARPWGNRYSLLGMESFFDRQSRFGWSGLGGFLTRDSIAKYEDRMNTSQMLMATIMDVRALDSTGNVILKGAAGGGCQPRYYLNGVRYVEGNAAHQSMMGVSDSSPLSQGIDPNLLFPPDNLEGIEVYTSPNIPAEFNQGFPCGVVAIWTRKAPGEGRPSHTWRRTLLMGGILGLMLFLML